MSQEHVMQHLRRASAAVLCASALLLASTQAAQAQSEVSVGLSMLPVASVVGAASVAGAAASTVVAIPVALAVSGAVLTVKAIEASAHGTVIVLERASDAATASVVTTVIASGVILSAAGEVLCFIPNAIGRALLYNERIL